MKVKNARFTCTIKIELIQKALKCHSIAAAVCDRRIFHEKLKYAMLAERRYIVYPDNNFILNNAGRG